MVMSELHENFCRILVVRGGCTLLHSPLTTLLMQIKIQRPLVVSLGTDETKRFLAGLLQP